MMMIGNFGSSFFFVSARFRNRLPFLIVVGFTWNCHSINFRNFTEPTKIPALSKVATHFDPWPWLTPTSHPPHFWAVSLSSIGGLDSLRGGLSFCIA